MSVILIVAGSMLAAVGLVQIIAWFVCKSRDPNHEMAYKIIRLEHNPVQLAEQLQYELLLIHWTAPLRPEVLVMVDTGLGEEEKELCKRMLCDFQTALLCAPEELPDLIRARVNAYPAEAGKS